MLLPFDKYDLYHRAVQSSAEDVRFYLKTFKELRDGKKPIVLREDFCGTGAISCEWVKLDKSHKSCGLDLDEVPMEYGRKNYISKLTEDQRRRIVLVKKNVLENSLPRADISVACNFSYCFFKERETLKNYFQNSYNSLNKDGLFLIDIFGGTQCTDVIEDRTQHKDFVYYWDQQSFDPVTHEALFQIHFRYKGKKYKNVFTYDWRLWTIPEVVDIMKEVGFRSTYVYWEGDDKKGGGNGVFSKVEKGEPCLSWIAYVVGAK